MVWELAEKMDGKLAEALAEKLAENLQKTWSGNWTTMVEGTSPEKGPCGILDANKKTRGLVRVFGNSLVE